jgi:hypothetical protein
LPEIFNIFTKKLNEEIHANYQLTELLSLCIMSCGHIEGVKAEKGPPGVGVKSDDDKNSGDVDILMPSVTLSDTSSSSSDSVSAANSIQLNSKCWPNAFELFEQRVCNLTTESKEQDRLSNRFKGAIIANVIASMSFHGI